MFRSGRKRQALRRAVNRVVLESLEERRLLATFTVTNTNDAGPGSYRDALNSADDLITPGPDIIAFNIPGPGPHTIVLTAGTSSINHGVTIDGTTQPGFAGMPLIELRCTSTSPLIIDGPNAPVTIRGLAINSSGGSGIDITNGFSTITIQGNFIGVDPAGKLDRGNTGDGITINTATSVVIGGAGPGQGNIISGNNGHGIEIGGTSTGVSILGNRVGVGITGQALGNNASGIHLQGNASNTTIGGVAPGQGNILSNNGKGITLAGVGTGNTIRGNSIHNHPLGLGIDLGDNFNTPNDTGDPDTGVNNLQNFPTFSSVTFSGGQVSFIGQLNSTASAQFNIDFYLSEAADTLGFGEGQVYVGSTTVTTDALGNASYNVTFTPPKLAEFATATATRVSTGDTSEFNAAAGVLGLQVVTNTNDAGPGSLRQAINDAGLVAGLDTIVFDIPGAGPFVVQPTTPLQSVGSQVIIDGTSQPGFAGVPIVILDGSLAGSANGLTFIGGGASTVQGLQITGWQGNGIIVTASASGSTLRGNFIGTDLTGTPGLGNSISGIFLDGADNVTIGGFSPGDRNTISGNNIGIEGSGGTDNIQILSNFIGVNAIGNVAVPNNRGIFILGGNNISIGTLGAGNVISGNASHGVEISGGSGYVVEGNFIGVNSGGTAVPNGGLGLILSGGATGSTIGGPMPSHRNLISGNATGGILLTSGAGGNTLINNFVGTNAAGTAAIANAQFGIRIETIGNTIGGPNPAERNLISGNAGTGLFVAGGANNNTIIGNFIGTNSAGSAALPNTSGGLFVDSASNTRIGGNAAAGNVISGNIGAGIFVNSSASFGTLIFGNRIGTNAAGTAAVANAGVGIQIDAAPGTVVGPISTGSDVGNLISGNAAHGLLVVGTASAMVGSNTIGLGADGDTPIGNGGDGVRLAFGTTNTSLGLPGFGNFISANAGNGVSVVSSNGNLISGNQIGLNAAGVAARGNGVTGIEISDSANTIIGAASEGNRISGNGGAGIRIDGAASATTTILGNHIGLDATGNGAIGNGGPGIRILNTAGGHVIGGAGFAQGNVISGNTGAGIQITDDSSDVILGNFIGTDAGGNADIGNTGNGIFANNVPELLVGGSGSQRNVVSGNNSNGIFISNSAGVTASGNFVGTNAGGGGALGNSGSGIVFDGVSPGQIDSNRVAFNGSQGIRVQGTSQQVAATRNSIFSNTGISIDLGSDGNSPNDNLDADTGPNGVQNKPVIDIANDRGDFTIFVSGQLRSTPNSVFSIEFFISDAAGESESFFGSISVTTDSLGIAEITHFIPLGAPAPGFPEEGLPSLPGNFLTATATDSFGNTSELSPARGITQNAGPTANAGGPYAITEGEGITLDAGTSSDPESDQLTFLWDIDGNESPDFTVVGDPKLSLTWQQLRSFGFDDGPGSGSIFVSVRDPFGNEDGTEATLQIQNRAPNLIPRAAAATATNTPFRLELDAKDPGRDTIFQYIIDWGDGDVETYGQPPLAKARRRNSRVRAEGGVPIVTLPPSEVFHSYQEPGVYTIKVTAIDEDGSHVAPNRTVTVAPPLQVRGINVVAVEGFRASRVRLATLTHPKGQALNPDNFTASIRWGDGTTTEGVVVQGRRASELVVRGVHTYRLGGTYRPEVTVRRGKRVFADTRSTARVGNAPRLPLTFIPINAQAGVPLENAVFAFLDTNPFATPSDYQATIDWGDGTSPTAGSITQTRRRFEIRGTHTYATAGSFIARLRISDTAGDVRVFQARVNVA